MATCNDCFHWGACKNMIQLCNCKVFEVSEGAEECEHFTPTVDVVEVKHGKWENFEIPHMMRCSECGVSDLDIHRTKFAFCPNCGAKMDGGNTK